MNVRLFIPLLLLLGLGCGPVTTTVTPLVQPPLPARPENCEIQILTQAPTDRKYQELAILNTVTYGAQPKDLNAMLPSIKAAACALGADAVIIKSVSVGERSIREAEGKAYTVAIKFLN